MGVNLSMLCGLIVRGLGKSDLWVFDVGVEGDPTGRRCSAG